MKIKKFNCIQCGAPKINPYASPYIVCDFCGAFTDIDFEQGLDAWNKNPKRTQKYTEEKVNYETALAQLFGKGDKNNYLKTQFAYWDFYYQMYPEYLPPSIQTEEQYKLYIAICADSSTNAAFDEKWAEKARKQTELQQKISYHFEDGKTYADTDAFFEMNAFFIQNTKDSFQEFYTNPKYQIMHELLPPDVHLKMKLSMYVQAWIPYLRAIDVHRLLQQTGFSTEYIELQTVNGKNQSCTFCKEELFIPEGSYKILCEHCLKINTVQSFFNCISCGMKNEITESPAKPMNCISCGTENRLIKGWF